jgi:hypothetical protein
MQTLKTDQPPTNPETNMKRTFLTLTLAAQLVAVGAFAQTSPTTTGTTDSGVTSDTFGSEWSTALSSAFFTEGGTTIRAESELVNQWGTLSDEDKEMIRRDCMAYMQQSGDTTGTTGTAAGTTDSTGTGTTGSTSTTTGSTGTSTDSTATASGSAGTQSGTSDTTSGTSAAGTGAMTDVTMEQMEQICAATKDL